MTRTTAEIHNSGGGPLAISGHLTLSDGGLLQHSAGATITFPRPAGKTSVSHWLILAILLLLALLAASLLAFVIFRRRRSETRLDGPVNG